MIGQLTYACFAATRETVGGWSVGKREGLNAEDEKVLLQNVAATFPEDQSLPRFPTPDELSGRPRRLRVRPDEDRLLLWHTASAGVDASGRPGNAFTHAAIVQAAQLPATWIPIHAWRSPSCAVPYGADDVESADLMDGFPAPGSFSQTQQVIDFLNGGSARTQIWAILLDGLHDLQRHRSRIAIICDTAEEAAGWVASMTSVVGKGIARRISFCIWEQAADVGRAAQMSHIVCVDRASIRGAFTSKPGLWVIDPQQQAGPEPLDEGNVWMGAGADNLPVSDWSQVALDVIGAGAEKLHFCLEKVANGTPSAGHWLADFGSGVLALPDLALSHDAVRAFLAPQPMAKPLLDPRQVDQQQPGGWVPNWMQESSPARRHRPRPTPHTGRTDDIVSELKRTLVDGWYGDFRALAERASTAELHAADLEPEVRRTCQHFQRLLDRPEHSVHEAALALQFGDACWSLTHVAHPLEDSDFVPVMRPIVALLLSPEGGQLRAVLDGCSRLFVEAWVCNELNDQLRHQGHPPQALSPELAEWFTTFIGAAQMWRVAASSVEGTPLERLVARSRYEHGGPVYSWLRASPIAIDTATSRVTNPLAAKPGQPVAVAEMDWRLSRAKTTAQLDALWGSPEFVAGIDWPLGTIAAGWARQALLKYSALISGSYVELLLTVYRDIPVAWWATADWTVAAERLLILGSDARFEAQPQLLPEVATAVAMIGIATDMRLAQTLKLPGKAASALRERALTIARDKLPIFMLGARMAANRLIQLADAQPASEGKAEPWGARCAFLLIMSAFGPVSADFPRVDALSPLLPLPLPATWREAPDPTSLLELTAQSRRVQEHLDDIGKKVWKGSSPELELVARQSLETARRRWA